MPTFLEAFGILFGLVLVVAGIYLMAAGIAAFITLFNLRY